ncbi:MAG: glycosyltransferase family 4 protein [Thermoproteota archaeon]|nr:MAG: glycosyltransferase family 4 protein [Candidatus Korarchaeota archaeon]
MKVLTLTTSFPDRQRPIHAVFVKNRIKALLRLCQVKVIAPVPWVPLGGKLCPERYRIYPKIPYKEIQDSLEVFHPRYVVTPKIGRSLHGFMYFASILKFVKRFYQSYNFELLDVHWAYPDGFAGVLLGKLLRKPVVVTVRGVDINLLPNFWMMRKMITYTLKEADRVIAVCQALKNKSLELGIDARKITVIPNGVDIRRFYPLDKVEARKMLGLPLDERIVLSVGHLVERKGFHYIIDAISILRERGRRDISLFIVGAPGEEGNFKRQLENRIARLNLEDQVRMVGAKPNDELYKWYSAADIFCLASSREGWPNVLFESLACGTPVVATKVWGIPEVICSEDYGILVDRRSGKEIAEGILKALNKCWDYSKLVEYARRNTWDKVGQKVYSEFQDLLCKRGEKESI